MAGKEESTMSAKNMDRQGRWRSVTVAFRVSPEEDALIESAVKISGCTKQDYIIKKLMDQSVVVVVRRIKRCLFRQIIRYEFAA